MQDLKNYLDEKHNEFKAQLEKEFTFHTKRLQSELNQKMLEHIKFSKNRIETQVQDHINSYKQSIDRLIEKRNSGNLGPRRFDFLVKAHKKSLESKLQSTRDSWLDFINRSRANIK